MRCLKVVRPLVLPLRFRVRGLPPVNGILPVLNGLQSVRVGGVGGAVKREVCPTKGRATNLKCGVLPTSGSRAR